MSYLATSPFGALNQMNRELNRIFTEQPLEANVIESRQWVPGMDLSESEAAFHVVADVPGVNPDDIEISLHKGVLTIKGHRKTETETTERRLTRRERTFGSFFRQFTLPESADEDTVTARANNGVLEITIPKAEKTQPISIRV